MNDNVEINMGKLIPSENYKATFVERERETEIDTERERKTER